MLVRGRQTELFVNSDKVVWVWVENQGQAVRVNYADGSHRTFDALTLSDPDLIRELIREVEADTRFTPLAEGREFVNFDQVLGVFVNRRDRTVTVYLPGNKVRSIGPRDFATVDTRLSKL